MNQRDSSKIQVATDIDTNSSTYVPTLQATAKGSRRSDRGAWRTVLHVVRSGRRRWHGGGDPGRAGSQIAGGEAA